MSEYGGKSKRMTRREFEVLKVQDFERLEAENARLREALIFYADIRQYNRVGGDPPTADPPIVWERGARARNALGREEPEFLICGRCGSGWKTESLVSSIEAILRREMRALGIGGPDR